ncbi:MAG: VWA domain-containing protein [Acidobacteria bacterium]|nr:VWA domain-containing protein [Acidobacteriota bacterium]MBA3884123.1 VWA domain-containing protein [Acidobacteriota bacterium]
MISSCTTTASVRRSPSDNTVLPVTVVVMLDTSASMTLLLDRLKGAAEEFLIRLWPDDRAMVGAFNDNIQLLPSEGFISDHARLTSQLQELDFGYPTRLYEAVDRSVAALRPLDGRKVVVVFTDGSDTASRTGRRAVLKRAVEEDVMVYAFGLESTYFDGRRSVRTTPDGALRGLTADTGGGFFLLTPADDLGETFTRIAQELHSQYLLGFTPQRLDGNVHKLDVRVKQPGLSARARKSYLAGNARAAERRR